MTRFEVQVDGAALNVHAAGPEDAPRVVLLHGALSANRSMLSQLTALKGRYRCFAVDQRGHGKSTRFGEPGNGWERFTMDQLVADARVLMRELEPDAWVGVSMGGIVSANLAARSPRDVRALALLATAPGPSAQRSAFFKRLTPDSFDAPTRRLFQAWHGAEYWPALAEHVARAFQERHEADYAGARLSAYEGPALVLAGADDPLIATEELDQWTDWMPQADVRVLAGGHAFFAMEGKRETNRVLGEFLDRATGGSSGPPRYPA